MKTVTYTPLLGMVLCDSQPVKSEYHSTDPYRALGRS